jgi:molecular chaperone GrpE (heat shock protein)
MKTSRKEQKSSEKQETIPKHEHDELKDMLQRIHAEFQNYRARTEEENLSS